MNRIKEESLRGFAPSKLDVREMANRLLAERGGKPVGKNWVDNFIKHQPDIKSTWSRPYDRQRALCEDPALIHSWFDLVQNTKEKYGIVTTICTTLMRLGS